MLPHVLPIRFLLNPAARRPLPYGDALKDVLSLEAHEEAFGVISAWDAYAPTPLVNLPGLAGALGLKALWYKDEGGRLGLRSFKALGGSYGVYRVLREKLARGGIQGSPSVGLTPGSQAERVTGLTVTCASVGNHGQAVARGAAMFGCRAVIFLPHGTDPSRVKAIEGLGATVVRVEGSYDDAVLHAAERAEAEGWMVVSDTAYPGYMEVPRHIMQGYTVMVREALEQLPEGETPTHLFLQGGVGGLAAAVTAHFWERFGEERPRVIVVEPAEADCLLESALAGVPRPSRGSLRSSMDCLACRMPSLQAWKILEEGADAFLTIPDFAAEETVALLARGVKGDPVIRSMPSGAAGLAGLMAATFEPALSDPLGLGENSRVMIFGSEGPPEGACHE